ncbi:unnamed protein product [Jaminaea pallidilutea]
MLPRLAGRPLARRPLAHATRQCDQQRRCFSLKADTAATFLSKHLGVQVEPGTATSNILPSGLAFVIQADRNPQPLTDGTIFFGPSIAGCDAAELHHVDRSGLGPGDLGLLKLLSAHDEPAKVRKEAIDVVRGLDVGHARRFAGNLALAQQLDQSTIDDVAQLLVQMWTLFKEYEGIYFTLQVGSENGKIKLTAPFLEIDDYAVHRLPPDLQALHKNRQREHNAATAEDGGLFYIKLHNGGKVGSFGYGAGNAMGTMDGLALAGGKPANFLDGGGGANRTNSRLAIETLNRDPGVTSIFVYTFGGITQTDVVADGIIDAVRANEMKQPIVVRVKGTGSDVAKEKLKESGLGFIIEDDFKKAARLAVEHSEQR